MAYTLSPTQQAVKERIAARKALRQAQDERICESSAPLPDPERESAPSDPGPSDSGPSESGASDLAQSPPAQASAAAGSGPSLSEAIDDLPGDETRAPQRQFSLADQIVFLERLSTSGSVRSASRIARVSHQTVYRLRRACIRFRAGWNAALLLARDQAEATLADNALDGVEEDVWYHGEVVGTRRRFDARLLLAHLARLDRLADTPDAAFYAGVFDTVLERIAQDEPLPEMPPEAGECGAGLGRESGDGSAESLASGLCNTRSMSRPTGGDTGSEADFEGESGDTFCCQAPSWPLCRHCPDFPAVDRLLHEMEEQRPADAPPMAVLGDLEAVEVCQMTAFDAQDADWWRFGADYVLFEADGEGGWRPCVEPLGTEQLADAPEGQEEVGVPA